ncbi:PepSY domain-containing protein [Sedimentitalea nanhaiensis]|nr:PepSY domain-containing protein [Sedimentitalea nanhaiensis]
MTTGYLKTLALCGAMALAGGTAFASGDSIQLTDEIKAQITATLTEQGYEVSKIKTEDGLYEAYARKDGKRYEVFLNDKMEVVRTENDD